MSSKDAFSDVESRFHFDPETLMRNTPQFAIVEGTWYEMGYQLGRQCSDGLNQIALYRVKEEIDKWGSYDQAKEIYGPYLKLAEQYYINQEDGTIADLIRGISEGARLAYTDAAMVVIIAKATKEAGVPLGYAEDVEACTSARNCSTVYSFGAANADGKTGAIAAVNSDTGFEWFTMVPAVIYMPAHGNTFFMPRGVFGWIMNEKGLMMTHAGGAWDAVPDRCRLGLLPNMFIAAYCDTTQEAIDFIGDPETKPADEWWPMDWDYTMGIGDASGDAVIFELSCGPRKVRRCNYDGKGVVKYLGHTPYGDIKLAEETAQYVIGNNSFFSDEMLAGSRSNLRNGLEFAWPDTVVRYWTVEKYVQDAVARGGVTADTLREAQGSNKYYIPEGWDYDAYPENDYLGFWVPNHIYEGFENGTVSRAEYYGPRYDPDAWGEPLSFVESRAQKEWRAGWHDNLEEGWNLELDNMYWSPEPLAGDFKTTNRCVFDSNTKTAYMLRGSSNRLISMIPESTDTYIRIKLADLPGSESVHSTIRRENNDKALAIIMDMKRTLERYMWIAAKDMFGRGVDIDSADGKVVNGYLDTAKQKMFTAQTYQNMGDLCTDVVKKMEFYGKSITEYAAGQCYAQMATSQPEKIR